MEKTIKKEEKQLRKLRAAAAKPAGRWYPIILVIMIALVHLLDTYASDVVSKIQSFYVNDFFVAGKGISFESGLQKATLISSVGYLFLIIGPFYKSLMDKVGRRPIFIINTAGMALGMLLCYFSPNFIVFAVGQMCIAFFTMHDMQMIYIYEVAPNKWRSTLYFICKFIGVFGTLAIPLLRDRFIAEDGTGWRKVFLIPAAVGLVIFVLSAIFMRESDIYVESKIKELETPAEIRAQQKAENNEHKTGIFPAIKYIFKNKQLRWLTISLIVICTSTFAVTGYYESFLSTVYSVKEVNAALYLQPFAMAVMYLISGFLSDLIGRKKASVVFAFTAVAGFAAFMLASSSGVSPYISGALLGCYLGSFWNVTDLNGMMYAESCPTKIRGSVMGVQAIMLGVGMAVSLIACTVLLSFAQLGTVLLAVGVPGLVIGTVILIAKVKETKGADLSKIEFEQ